MSEVRGSRHTERVAPGEVDFMTWVEHVNRYVFAMRYVRGRTLDVGCGTGYGIRYLRINSEMVVGMDVSASALSMAKNRTHGENVELMLADAHFMPFRNSAFDSVTCLETIEHLENIPLFLDETVRILKEGGKAVFSTPNKNASSPWNGEPLNIFHRQELRLDGFSRYILRRFRKIVAIRGQVNVNVLWSVHHYLSHGRMRANKLVKWILPFVQAFTLGKLHVLIFTKLGLINYKLWATRATDITSFRDSPLMRSLYIVVVAGK